MATVGIGREKARTQPVCETHGAAGCTCTEIADTGFSRRFFADTRWAWLSAGWGKPPDQTSALSVHRR